MSLNEGYILLFVQRHFTTTKNPQDELPELSGLSWAVVPATFVLRRNYIDHSNRESLNRYSWFIKNPVNQLVYLKTTGVWTLDFVYRDTRDTDFLAKASFNIPFFDKTAELLRSFFDPKNVEAFRCFDRPSTTIVYLAFWRCAEKTVEVLWGPLSNWAPNMESPKTWRSNQPWPMKSRWVAVKSKYQPNSQPLSRCSKIFLSVTFHRSLRGAL